VYDEEEPIEVEKKTKTEKLCDQLTRSIVQPFMDTNLRARETGVVRVMSRGLDMAPHWSRVGAAPLMSPRQDETSEPLLYAGWMAGPYRVEDAMRGQNDDPVTVCWLRKGGGSDLTGMLKIQYDVVWSSQCRIRWNPERVMD
ncbi:hypothetical protein Tco_1486921, partial [Tanacetum coccineum]